MVCLHLYLSFFVARQLHCMPIDTAARVAPSRIDVPKHIFDHAAIVYTNLGFSSLDYDYWKMFVSTDPM